MELSRTTIAGLVDSLPNSGDPVATLGELKTALYSLHPSALKDVVANMSFNLVFEFLNTSNREQVSVCCEVLGRLLSVLDVPILLENFITDLGTGLHHPLPEVALVCLEQILRVSEESAGGLGAHRKLLLDIVDLLAVKNTDLSKEARKILVSLGASQGGLEVLFSSGHVIDELRQVMTRSDEVRFRVYEVVVEVCKISPESLQLCTSHGLLQQLVNEVYRDDLLGQLNALELLKELALCEHGLIFLGQQGILGKLQEMIAAVDTNPMGGLLMPGLVKFFGTVARLHPTEVCDNYPAFITTMFDLVDCQDVTLKGVAIETVGFIGKPVTGKLTLNKQGNRMTNCVHALGSSLKHDTSDMRLKTMATIAALLHTEGNQQTEEVHGITEKWYRGLHQNPMETLMSLSRQPFMELHQHALLIIKSMATSPWGQIKLNNYPGFNEFLLDRSTEKSKEGKEIKYDIVRVLVESSSAADIFGQPYFVRLRVYAREGPFYVQAQSEVAFEGDS